MDFDTKSITFKECIFPKMANDMNYVESHNHIFPRSKGNEKLLAELQPA